MSENNTDRDRQLKIGRGVEYEIAEAVVSLKRIASVLETWFVTANGINNIRICDKIVMPRKRAKKADERSTDLDKALLGVLQYVWGWKPVVKPKVGKFSAKRPHVIGLRWEKNGQRALERLAWLVFDDKVLGLCFRLSNSKLDHTSAEDIAIALSRIKRQARSLYNATNYFGSLMLGLKDGQFVVPEKDKVKQVKVKGRRAMTCADFKEKRTGCR